MGLGNNMLFDYYNRAVYETLLKYLEGREDCVFPLEFIEFDDCKYLLTQTADGQLMLSMSLPAVEPQYQSGMMNDGLLRMIHAVFKIVAALVQPPEGYLISLQLNSKTLKRMSSADRVYWLKQLCSIRLTIMGNPIRRHFQELAHAVCAAGPVEAHCNRPGQVYFVKPNKESVTVIFPMRFVTSQDAAIGNAFLQEFVEARRTAALGMSPSCSYLPAKTPPLELQGVAPELLVGANGGFMCFTMFQRHVNGPQLESVLWSMCTFYYLIGYHIKCCKAMMHTRMRSKVDQMLQSLSSGPAAALVVPEKASRRGLGRTGSMVEPGYDASSMPRLPSQRLNSWDMERSDIMAA